MAVHDLPQLYIKPSAESLLKALDLLRLTSTDFSTHDNDTATTCSVAPSGIPYYLTKIISSPLLWLEEPLREQIHSLASTRLSERAGRAAMPTLTRTFAVPLSAEGASGAEPSDVFYIALMEPSLTEDNLGFKTWGSALVLARKLYVLEGHLSRNGTEERRVIRVLELGAGTGLVGIAASCVWMPQDYFSEDVVSVTLSDLPGIMGNLEGNVERNREELKMFWADVKTRSLDWGDAKDGPTAGELAYDVVVAADPIYSPEHPGIFVEAVERWLRRREEGIGFHAWARLVLALPIREGYESERQELKQRLLKAGLEIAEEGTEKAKDDWKDEVQVWWAVYRPVKADDDV